MWKQLTIFLISLHVLQAQGKSDEEGWSFVGNPLLHAYACKNTTKITVQFEPGLPPGEENRYNVFIQGNFPKYSKIKMKFDTEATLTLNEFYKNTSRISSIGDTFFITFFNPNKNIGFKVVGPPTGAMPYLTSVIVNNVDYCKNPDSGYLDSYVLGYQDTAEVHLSVPDDKCGRRKVQHTALITNGLDSKPGDFPWHVALYRLEKATVRYICGGTLLTTNFVLTAAHCVTVRGEPVVPEILSVLLGKFNLIGGDVESQEKEVLKITVHEGFVYKNLNNDIALLKLKTEVAFGDFIQPACLWYNDALKKLPQGDLFGTVAGWGFDHTDSLSSTLKQATVPIVSESKCIKSNPLFFGSILNSRKFCAGWNNGTSACNGDSGGGFHIFIPDKFGDTSSNPTGAWYIRGIVSLSASRKDVPLCDPNQYVIFTDVSKYREWLKKGVPSL